MPLQVSDFPSNANEQIAYAAEAIGRSAARRTVFDVIHTDKRQIKTVQYIAEKGGLTRKQVLDAAKQLVNKGLVEQVKENGDTAYKKNQSLHSHKKQILALAGDKKRLATFPTKRKVAIGLPATIKLATRGAEIQQITLDDIGSFKKAHLVEPEEYLPSAISEYAFKKGVQRILGEPGKFTDWGGEKNDLLTTRLRIDGRRRTAAFAFKGPGTTGTLTPAKMGKNGDQILRLFQSSADVFIVQYWRDIAESVLDLMKNLATAKSVMHGQKVWYGLIDGVDSNRLYQAYSETFLSNRASK